MRKQLVSSELLDNIEGFFDRLCNIEEYKETSRDDYNDPVYEWTSIHSAIPCRIGVDNKPEVRTEDYNYSETVFRVVLKGLFKDIDETNRIVTDIGTLDVINTPEDSCELKTTLLCRKTKV